MQNPIAYSSLMLRQRSTFWTGKDFKNQVSIYRRHPSTNRLPPPSYSPEAVFSALADPTRRAVLDLLRRGSLPAGRIAQAFPVSRPAVSKHLRLLRRAHLVEERRHGRHRVYQLNPGPLLAVDAWLNHYRAFWQANLTSLKAFVEASHAKEISAGTRKQRK
jgi:DNA-binding transcriptional ArsR family regulator